MQAYFLVGTAFRLYFLCTKDGTRGSIYSESRQQLFQFPVRVILSNSGFRQQLFYIPIVVILVPGISYSISRKQLLWFSVVRVVILVPDSRNSFLLPCSSHSSSRKQLFWFPVVRVILVPGNTNIIVPGNASGYSSSRR